MGPATTLTSPRRYSELGAVGVELTMEPAEAAGATALPAPPPLLRRHAATDSVSLEADDDSASTSVIMDSEYVMLDDHFSAKMKYLFRYLFVHVHHSYEVN